MPVLEALSHLCVILGIGFAALEYSGQAADKREQNALDFLQQFHDAPLTEARLRLQAYWFDVPVAQISGKPGSAGVIDALALEQIFPTHGGKGSADLIRLVERLDVIATCVRNAICDPAIIRQQLGDYAQNLLCLYRAPLDRLRRDYALPNLGRATGSVLTAGGSCD